MTDTQLPTIAQELDQALVTKGVTDEVIEQLMQRALPHAKPIEDDDQYKAAEEARKEIKKVRIIGEKGIDAVDRRYLDLRQASLARKKELLERINAPEVMILQHTKAYERKKAQEEAERERLIREMQEQRKADILATGATFTPGPPEHRYSIGEYSWSAREINEADHETWTNMLRSSRMVQEEIAAHKAQQELEAQQERERIAAEAEALRQQQAEMARREAEMREREEAMKRQLNEVRKGELMALGLEVIGDNIGIGARGKELFSIAIYRLCELSDTQWADELLAAKLAIEERNLWQAEKAELARLEQERLASEVARQEAIEQERKRAEAETSHPSVVANEETVTVNRARLLTLLFSIQEVLPYSKIEGNDKWNSGVESLADDVMSLRHQLKDETLGPGADNPNEPW